MTKFLACLCLTLAAFEVAHAESVTSPNTTDWGVWDKDFDRCPEGSLVQGFQLKVEGLQGPADDTCLNGIKLFCGNPTDDSTPTITGSQGEWGVWKEKFRCSLLGYITGFALRVEAPDFAQDETATNNLRAYCSKNPDQPVEGDGGPFGQWAEKFSCPEGTAVCGLKTQVEEDQGNFRDDTALNRIEIDCCKIPA